MILSSIFSLSLETVNLDINNFSLSVSIHIFISKVFLVEENFTYEMKLKIFKVGDKMAFSALCV